MSERVVLPVDPARGWAEATVRRVLAVGSIAYVAAVLAVMAVAAASPDSYEWTNNDTYFQAVVGLAVLVGPPTFYAAARVLRPHLPGRRDWERVLRHVLASTATAFAVPVLAALLLLADDDAFGVVVVFGVCAFGLGVLTAVWGAVAAAVRLAVRRSEMPDRHAPVA